MRHAHSPRVRRLAAQTGVALTHLVGTGPAGRVTVLDVHRAAATRAAEPTKPPVSSSVRATTVVEVDVTPLVRLDDRLTVFLARAAIEAVREHPEFNAATFNVAAEAGRQAAIHLTVATDTPQGPRVSVIRDAGDLNLSGLARRIGERVDDPRAGIVPPQQGTFTLADSASRDVLFDTPILPPGQIAILGTGAVVERPVVMRRTDGEAVIAIRSMVYLALTYDARLVEAVAAARFLTTVRAWLTKDPHAAQ